ncbi:hypothetical protein [Poriferisphaera sp. WC338]|uniref:hypothetical protein n=1 Tax=Poriferisphaera sp. WC338 TaxID=3425129 RepID=UPI003D816A9C
MGLPKTVSTSVSVPLCLGTADALCGVVVLGRMDCVPIEVEFGEVFSEAVGIDDNFAAFARSGEEFAAGFRE